MKKRIIISLYFGFIFSALTAQNVPQLQWAKAMGGTGSAAYGRDVTVDAPGNVYTTGDFAGTVDFDSGTGTANLTASGIRDVFISKLDANGNFVWAKSIGAAGTDMSYGIALDDAGNVYITGQFAGTVDFDPGPGVFNVVAVNAATSGYYDIFVLKLNTNGDFVWAKSMGGSNTDYGHDIAVDASGNVHLTGAFSFTVDFDPGAAINNLIATAPGNLDAFVLKLNTNGGFVWARNMGSSNEEKGYGIALDASGNVYTTGTFGGVADFDPGVATYTLTPASGYLDIFVSKLNASGNFVWAKAVGGANVDTGQNIIVDASGNVYTTGNYSGTADFDPGAGVFNLTATGSYDVFIVKLDTNGDLLWAKSTGGTGIDYGYAVAVDPSGNVYTTGSFAGAVDFDPGAGTFNLSTANPSSAYHDAFLSKLHADGNFEWATSVGGGSEDEGYGIAIDASSNIYSTGIFQGTTDFDPGAATFNLTAAASDIFVYKLSPSLTSLTITSFTPASGLIGTTVIITGTNFSTTPASNTVKFNGITATASASTATTITTAVPAGATTGLITVTVSGETATSTDPFTVTTNPNGQPPIIATQELATQIGGIITLDLVPLITTSNNNLDIGSIEVTVPPASGAVAEITDGVLTINYSALPFSGTEQITIIACDLNDNCVTQQFDIEVGGELIVYNAVSPNGANPTLVIRNIEVLTETKKNTITIFDRWQNEVWRGTDYDNTTVVFKGISDGGKELPTGTYFYKIDFTTGRKSLTGFISLKR